MRGDEVVAYDEFGDLALHISAGSPTTVDEAVGTLQSLEYAYNLLAVVELLSQGHSPPIYSVLQVLLYAEDAGVHTSNHALRCMIPPDARLQLDVVSTGGSHNVKVSGLGKVLTAVKRIVDEVAAARAVGEPNSQRGSSHQVSLEETAHTKEVVGETLEAWDRNYTDRLRELLDSKEAASLRRLQEIELERAIRGLGPAETGHA